MTVQDCTSIVHTPRYSCHQDVNGFEIELHEDGEQVEIDEIDQLAFTIFDVSRLRPYLDAFCTNDKRSVRITVEGEDGTPVLLSSIEGQNGIPGDYPTFRIGYFREDDGDVEITPLNMPKKFADFDTLLAGFHDLVKWMDGSPTRTLALYFTPKGEEEMPLCEIMRDNGNLRNNAFRLYASGLPR